MLNAIISWSLRNRFAVLVGALCFVALGSISLRYLNIDAFPDTTPVQVQINALAPGLGPEEVERQITFPVEQAISGLPSLEQVRSISKFGLSQVVVTFADGTDIYFARQLITERLNAAELPEGMPRPRLGPVATGLGEAFHYLITNDRHPVNPEKRDEGRGTRDESEKASGSPLAPGPSPLFSEGRGTRDESGKESGSPLAPLPSPLFSAQRADDLMEQRTLQEWVLKPVLRTVPGTAEINTWGGLEKQYQVLVDPRRLLMYDLTYPQVVQAVRDNNLNAGGGNTRHSGEMLLIQALGRTNSLEQIRKIVIRANEGVPVHVGDVAEVRVGPALRLGAVTAQGEGEVVLGLGFVIMNENSHLVTERLKNKFDELKKDLPRSVRAEAVYQRTDLVGQVIDTVRSNLLEGGLLVVAVLFIFLGNLRAGLVVALAIPLSMLFAFNGMLRFGIAASLLSLGALDFGLVVDSSVVMVENVMRHLAHARGQGSGARGQRLVSSTLTPDSCPLTPAKVRSPVDIVRDAAIEVRQPTMFGELIIMIVYVPILALEGVEGKLFRPMALTVIFALAGSLILSLTVMPVLASLLLPARVEEREPWIIRLGRWLYRPLLHAAIHQRLAVILFTLGSLATAGLVARDLGWEFVPRLSEGAFVVGIMRLPGTSLEESLRYNTQMERILLASFPDEVEYVWSRCGTAEVATDPMGPEETDFFITLKPRHNWTRAATQDELRELIRQKFDPLPGQVLSYTQPIEQRVNEMISGVRSDVAIKLFGDDLQVLTEKAEQIQNVLQTMEEKPEVSVEQLTGQPMLQIVVRQDQLARHGVPARSVMDLVESLAGRPVGEVMEGQFRFPLAVHLPPNLRDDREAVGSILVTTPSGKRLPLAQLARIEVVEGPNKIMREAGQRRIVVQCNVRSRDLEGFINEARRRIAEEVVLPKGRYRLEWGGTFEHLQRARARLAIVVPIALALIFALLYLTYHRLADVFLVCTGVPFALVGGVLALWVRGLPFSVSAGVGFIALCGVSVLNSMVLVSFIRHLQDRGVPLDEAVEEAALTRLRPVLMTALVASLGFVPMALSTGVGAEVQRPLATVVIGGVISSTVLTLLVLPVLYDFFEALLREDVKG
jgi:cobalt-zinc-cadmium resistance protein CzcA